MHTTEPCTTKQVQYIPSFILLLEYLKSGQNFPSLVNPGFTSNEVREQPAEQLILQGYPSASYGINFKNLCRLILEFTNLGLSTQQGDHSPHQSITAES